MLQATLIAPITLCLVLTVSAIGKVRDPGGVHDAFREMRVPAPFDRPIFAMLLPLAELLLAGALLVASGIGGLLVNVAALVLFVVYFVLVNNVLKVGVEAKCACFGSLTTGRVTEATRTRNIAFVAVAVLSVIDISVHWTPALWRMFELPGNTTWLAASALAALVATVIVRDARPRPILGKTVPEPPVTVESVAEELADYLRTPIPFGSLYDEAGEPKRLREMAQQRPVLLLFLSVNCSPCHDVAELVPGWRTMLPMVDVVVVGDPGRVRELWPAIADGVLVDRDFEVGQLLQLGTPGAVLLGADGLLAGGPVSGSTQIIAFVDDILAEIGAAEAEAAAAEAVVASEGGSAEGQDA